MSSKKPYYDSNFEHQENGWQLESPFLEEIFVERSEVSRSSEYSIEPIKPQAVSVFQSGFDSTFEMPNNSELDDSELEQSDEENIEGRYSLSEQNDDVESGGYNSNQAEFEDVGFEEVEDYALEDYAGYADDELEELEWEDEAKLERRVYDEALEELEENLGELDTAEEAAYTGVEQFYEAEEYASLIELDDSRAEFGEAFDSEFHDEFGEQYTWVAENDSIFGQDDQELNDEFVDDVAELTADVWEVEPADEANDDDFLELEDPLEEGEVWRGSSDQVAFLNRVLNAHIALRRKQKGPPKRDLSSIELKSVAGTQIKMGRTAAVDASRLLAAANADLIQAKAVGHPDAKRTIRLSPGSGYRSSTLQRKLWRRYFCAEGGYYDRTEQARARLAGGPHSDQAVKYMLKPIGNGGFGLTGRIAAPGYSNHQGGIAIDFKQERYKGHAIRNKSNKATRAKWKATWFHDWLKSNAARFGFGPIRSEEWHWVYRRGASTAAPSQSVAANNSASVNQFPSWLSEIVKGGLLTLQAAWAMLSGQRDVNTLTNMIFYARHPDLPVGYKIKSHEKQLVASWARIRDDVVKPILRRLAASSVPSPSPTSMSTLVKPSPRVIASVEQYRALVEAAAGKYGVDSALIRGVIAAESGGKKNLVAKSGYTGLMQSHKGESQKQPAVSIDAGTKKLRDFRRIMVHTLKKYGRRYDQLPQAEQIRMLALAYNAGPVTVAKALQYATEAGNPERWLDAEHYKRALFFTGAYSLSQAATSCQKGVSSTERSSRRNEAYLMWLQTRLKGPNGRVVTQKARNWRSVADPQPWASVMPTLPPFLVCAINFKHRNAPLYANRILAYRNSFLRR